MIDPRKRLEDIEEQLVMNAKLKIEDVNWLIRQAKRVEELEETLHVINAVRYIPDEVGKEVQRALE